MTAALPRIYDSLPFLLLASLFLNGNPLVLLSAPVLLLMWLPAPNMRHHKPNAARMPDPTAPNRKPPVLVALNLV